MATRTLIVGDSLGVGTAPHLRKLLGGRVDADTVVGRSSSNGIQALRQRGGSYDRIVLDLGTNDGSAADLMNSIRQAQRLAPNAEIIVPTVNGPAAGAKNAAIRKLTGGNIRMVDWNGRSKGLLSGDGIHATPQGYEQRARMIARELYDDPDPGPQRPTASLTPGPLLQALASPQPRPAALPAPYAVPLAGNTSPLASLLARTRYLS